MEQIKLDLIPGKMPPTCHVSQYDDGRSIRLDLYEGGQVYTLGGTEVITLKVRKPDGNFVTKSVTATLGNTYVTITTTEQMTAVAGMNLCELEVVRGGNTLGTMNFIMNVEMDPIDGASASQSVIENLQAMVDAAVAASPYPAEVEDIRNGADGIVYPSAGDAVRDQIDRLNDLTLKTDTVTEVENLKTFTTWTNGWYMTLNGTINSNASYSYSAKLPVKEGDVINCSSNMRFVTAFNGNTAVPTKGGDTVSTYTVPSGVTSVVISVLTAVLTTLSYTLTYTHDEVVYSNLLSDDVTQLQSDVADLQNEYNNLAPEDISGITIVGGNLLSYAVESHPGTYASKNASGKVQYSANATYNSVVVPIQAKKYTKTSGNNPLRFVLFLQSDKSTVIGSALGNVDEFDNSVVNAPYAAISYYAAEPVVVLGEGEPDQRTYNVAGRYQFENLVSDVSSVIHTYLPPEICVGVGRTVELYNDLVCLEADKYHINWDCTVGIAYKRKFSITGTNNNKGTYTLKFKLYDDGLNLLVSKSCTLKIVDNTIANQLKIVPIGDSLTNKKSWEREVQTLSNDLVSFIGTRKGTYNSYTHEGRSGASAGWYTANSTYTFDNDYCGNPLVPGDSNPFWDTENSKFSMSHYISEQAATIGTPDVVLLFLGTNGMAMDPTTTVNNIKTMIDTIKAEYPTMPIFLCNTIYRSNQDGYHSTGADGYVPAADYQYDADRKVMNLQNALAETFGSYSNVFIIPLSICMDRDNDFGQVEVPVNPRLTTVTTHIASESIHPQEPGYMQIADVVYSSLVAHLS